jgi:hypothetical protein
MPSDKKTLNQLSNCLKNILKKYNSDKYQSYIESLSNNKNSIWKSTKKILNHRQIMPPLRNSNNSLAITNIDKANLISTYLEDNFKPNNDINDKEHNLTIENILNQPLPMSFPAKHTTPSEITFIINKLPYKKAPEHDLITNRILKNLPKKPILFLTHIYNASLRLSFFPSYWKKSNIIPILKPNKPPT